MRYILTRVVQGIFILLGVSIITFFLPWLYFNPRELALQVLQGGPRINQAEITAWVHQHGLDRNLLVQYWSWLTHAIHGDFGIAYKESHYPHDVSVNTVLSGRLWRSVYLVVPPTIASILIAIPIGLTQAIRRNKLYDHAMTTGVFVLYSTPAVLVCILMAYYFGAVLHIGKSSVNPLAQGIPPSQFPSYMITHFSDFLLPMAAILFLSIGGLTRYMRGSALDTLVQDYIRTARAKGASPTRVLFRHVFRPSVIPLITIVGLTIPVIIGGALIVEFIFNFPGMGIQTVSSVQSGDFTVVMAITIFTAVLTVVGNLLADVFTAVADPRVRLTAAR
ncbi:MAG TPA: ABC transporter permease [Acidimicrobiales bacterium]|jgi:peptide/nickel transport system permease protein|nr:ABC transporter permease [Acidimicrobiales bacterium]